MADNRVRIVYVNGVHIPVDYEVAFIPVSWTK
jgi:hypothetical protein